MSPTFFTTLLTLTSLTNSFTKRDLQGDKGDPGNPGPPGPCLCNTNNSPPLTQTHTTSDTIKHTKKQDISIDTDITKKNKLDSDNLKLQNIKSFDNKHKKNNELNINDISLSNDYNNKKINKNGDRAIATDNGEVETYTFNVYNKKLKKNYDESINNNGHSGNYIGKEYDRKNKLNTNKLIFNDKMITDKLKKNNKNNINNKLIDDKYVNNENNKYTKYGENDQDKYTKEIDFNSMYDKPYQYSSKYSNLDENNKDYGTDLTSKKNQQYTKYNDIYIDNNLKNKNNIAYNKGKLIDVKNEGYNKENIYDGNYNKQNNEHNINNKISYIENSQSFTIVTGGVEVTIGGENYNQDKYINNENYKYGKYNEMNKNKYKNGKYNDNDYKYKDNYNRYENDDEIWKRKYDTRQLLVFNELNQLNNELYGVYWKFGLGIVLFGFQIVWIGVYGKNRK